MSWRAEQGLLNGGQILGYDLDPQHPGIPAVGKRNRTMHDFILEGMVICGACGSMMSPNYSLGRNRIRYYYYKCTCNDHKGKTGCPMKAVPAEPLEDLVVKYLAEIGRNEVELDGVVRTANEATEERKKELREKRRILNSQLGPLVQVKENVLQAIKSGAFQRGGANAMALELEDTLQRIEQIEREILALDDDEGHLDKMRLDHDIMRETLIRFPEFFQIATPQERKVILQSLASRIVWSTDEVKVFIFQEFMGENRTPPLKGVNPDGGISLEFENWLRR